MFQFGKSTLLIGLALISFFSAIFANAEGESVFISPAYIYYTRTEESPDGTETEETFSNLDIRGGYIFMSGLYLGGIYSMENREVDSAEYERTSYGASVGYMKSGYAIIGHYFLSSEQKRPSTTYTDGSGYQIDLAYHIPLSSSVLIGPQVSYKKFTYKKYELGGTKVSPSSDLAQTGLFPAVVLAFVF